VSAVFAVNDRMAGGAMQAIFQAGLRVPEDVSVLGCEDTGLAEELEPGLASFRMDTRVLVEQGFSVLEQAWRLAMPKKIVLGAEFVCRGTVGERKKAFGFGL